MRLPNRRVLGPLAAVLLATAPALGDEIYLKGGGRVSGRIVERTATRVAIETGPGRVTLPLTRVERIVEGRSTIEAFAEQAADLAAGDVAGWADLARWAEQRDLLTQARFAWQRVLATDPGHPEANAGLGRVPVDGEWMSSDDAYRARGYVPYEGRWLTPAEHEAAVRERETDDFLARWHIDSATAKKIHDALANLYTSLDDEEVVPEGEMLSRFLDELKGISEAYKRDEVLKRWLTLSKKIGKNPLGEWGRVSASAIRTKGIRDYAYLAIKRQRIASSVKRRPAIALVTILLAAAPAACARTSGGPADPFGSACPGSNERAPFPHGRGQPACVGCSGGT